MSRDQALAALPGSTADNDGDLSFAGIEVGGKKAHGYLIFNEGAFYRAMVQFPEAGPAASKEKTAAYHQLQKLLRDKYGPPASERCSQDEHLDFDTALWLGKVGCYSDWKTESWTIEHHLRNFQGDVMHVLFYSDARLLAVAKRAATAKAKDDL